VKTEEFDFNPGARVMPSDPVELRGKRREDGRMVVLERSTATIKHTVFSTIYNYLQPGDLLVLMIAIYCRIRYRFSMVTKLWT
jgi:S-adenosylmethionine:tRNA ribosyltransferase-isomerase